MRICLLLVTLVPGLAFPAADPELKTNIVPVSPFSTADSQPKANVPPTLTYSGLKTNALTGSTSVGVYETIVVVPDSEDLPSPEKNRWTRFEEALGPGRTASRRHRTYGWRNNDNTRVECIAPCIINCCVESGVFSLQGSGGTF